MTPKGSLAKEEVGEMPTEAKVRSDRARHSYAHAYWFYCDLVTIHVGADQTGGRFCVVEFLQPPDEWTPLHVHRDSDQTQYVLDGELTVYVPDRSLVLGPGECVNTPRNVPHTEHVTSAGRARVLDVNVPAGFDEFIASAGEPATELSLPAADGPPPDVERLAAIAAEHGIELLGPPGQRP
jgi:mannose-6-phosphate isomerase-like protein (cupin superfamily)